MAEAYPWSLCKALVQDIAAMARPGFVKDALWSCPKCKHGSKTTQPHNHRPGSCRYPKALVPEKKPAVPVPAPPAEPAAGPAGAIDMRKELAQEDWSAAGATLEKKHDWMSDSKVVLAALERLSSAVDGKAGVITEWHVKDKGDLCAVWRTELQPVLNLRAIFAATDPEDYGDLLKKVRPHEMVILAEKFEAAKATWICQGHLDLAGARGLGGRGHAERHRWHRRPTG